MHGMSVYKGRTRIYKGFQLPLLRVSANFLNSTDDVLMVVVLLSPPNLI